ncbi:hypothetical protein CZP2022_127 [Vibrio phage C-ZP2022]|nr:hypothetical protein CZP2022_127 [Vibrio phage C-ZP2022]
MIKRVKFETIDTAPLSFGFPHNLAVLSNNRIPERAVLDPVVILKSFELRAKLQGEEFPVASTTLKNRCSTFYITQEGGFDDMFLDMTVKLPIEDEVGRFLFDRHYDPQQISRLAWEVHLVGEVNLKTSVVKVSAESVKLSGGGKLSRTLNKDIIVLLNGVGYNLDATFS